METSVILIIIFGAITGVSRGAGVLPDSLIATIGQTVTFTTTVTPTEKPFLIVSWSFAGGVGGADTTIITSSTENITKPDYADRITLFRSTGSLELRKLTLTDIGNYKVLIIPDGGAQQKGNCKLMIYAPVSIVQVTSSSTDLVELSSVRLSCSSSGSSLSFLWLNGSSEVTAGDGVQLTDGGATLTIVSVSRYDLGPFRCHAFNPISNGTSDPVHLSISYGPENINFTVLPPQEYFIQGSEVILRCSAASRPPAHYVWFLNGGQLSHTGPELRLMNAHMNQSGSYGCRAYNNKTLKHQTSKTSSITIQAPVSHVKVNTSLTEVFESSSVSVSLSCSASGSSLSFQWLNDTTEVTASDRVHITNGGATLTIMNVTRHDEGPFKCHVFNLASSATSESVNLNVLYGPENINLTRSPSQEYYYEGADINLECLVSSRPFPTFSWFLNENLLPETGPELRLVNIQKSQGGNYSCQALNNRTMQNQTSGIQMITVLSSEIANVVITPNATDVSEFSSVRLSCFSFGSFPSYVWLNNSAQVSPSDRVQLTDQNATLTISSVSRYDLGPFICHVFNNVSNGTSDPVQLSVNYGPENVLLKLSPPQQHFVEGSNISMMCSAVSRPAALFQWFVNGDELPHTEAELTLMNIQESQSGNYSCRAFNNKTLRYQTSPAADIYVLTEIENVVITPNATDVSEFSSVCLSCFSFGSFPSYIWLNNSAQVSPSDRVQLTDQNATLTISSVSRYDLGPFICHVYNNFSNGTSDPVQLSVNYGPENVLLKLSPPQQHFVEGSNISMMCSAVSRPAALFQWFFNGDELPHTEAELTLMSIQESQSGNYSCRAFNNKTLRYQTSPAAAISILTAVSNVLMISNNQDLFEFSSSASLSCSASGSSLSFLWLNHTAEVTVGGTVQLADGGKALNITNTTRYHQGPFRCNVSNGVSFEVSRAVNLFIQYGPDSVAIEGPDSVHVGDVTMLYCSTESVPPAKITWLFNGNPTDSDKAAFIIRSSRSSNSGTYSCTATNAVTGKSRTVEHELAVIDFSDCDCSVAAGVAVMATIGCCIVIAAVCAAVGFAIKNRNSEIISNPYTPDKYSVKEDNPDMYMFAITKDNDLYSIHSEVA